MIEKQNATHSNELTKLGASELGAAQLERFPLFVNRGGFPSAHE